MRLPAVRGVIERRILLNYRVEPHVLQSLLPAPFRPKLVDGMGIAGVCLIRLNRVRPRGVPSMLGVGSENAAHRIAVAWDEGGTTRDGVYIPRRDSSSHLNTVVGGRLFPGTHHHARFEVVESDLHFRVGLTSDDLKTHVLVEGSLAPALSSGSVFPSIEAASDFFARGSLGYSPAARSGAVEGLELRSFTWRAEPLTVERAESSFFANTEVFPPGSVQLDCALLMRDIEHEWHAREAPCQG